MQIRSTKVRGLDPIEAETPASLAKLSITGAAAAFLILGCAYLIGMQMSSPGGSSIHPTGKSWSHGALAAKSAPAALADTVPPQTFVALTPEQALVINEQIPFSLAPNPPAAPFRLSAGDLVDQTRALACLTMAVYYEAANQGDVGEAAVAQVVLNRVRHPAFPKTVCGVVFQGSTLPTGCQFTFTCDGSLNRPPDPAGWKHASLIAQQALNGYVEPLVGQATHYHTVWVVPYWQTTVEKVAQIGAHVFYRWSGPMGQARLLSSSYAGAEPLPPNVNGFDLGGRPLAPTDPATVVPPAASRLTDLERELSGPRREIVAPIEATVAVQKAAVRLSAPVSPERLIQQPEVLHVENPQGNSQSNHRLAIPQSW